MNLYQLVVALNNRGASSLQKDCTGSCFLFQAALEIVVAALGEADMFQGVTAPFDIAFEPLISYLDADERKFLEATPIMEENAFVRAIFLNSSPTGYSQNPRTSFEVASAIVIFNLAVASHRKVLTAQDLVAEKKARHAKTIYLKCLESFNEIGISLIRSSRHEVIDIVIMAVFNNLAQISYVLSNFEVASTYFTLLQAFAGTVHTHWYGERSACILNWHKTVFYLNATFMRAPSAASAA